MENKNKGRILAVPFPIQGHVIPMMKLSENITSHGMQVTLLITEHNYKGMVNRSMIDLRDEDKTRKVRLATVPDGLEPDDDRKDHYKVSASVSKVMPEHVYKLVAKAKEEQKEGDGPYTCLIADPIFAWAPKVAEDIGIKFGVFWAASPGALAATIMIPEFLKTGCIDQQGKPLKKDVIKLLPSIPSMTPNELPWHYHHEETFAENKLFKTFCTSEQDLKKAKWVLCNWFQDLTPSSTTTTLSNTIQVGPLLANTQQNEAYLYPEDSACLLWLDQQPSRSVIYVAFGSILSMSQTQLTELAHGLELTGRRFLWAVRADMSSRSALPEGFEERIANCGKLIEWASQEKVLAHPSIACFVTHCGWNSIMEGLSCGVPLLCWPCFADQFYTRTCICDAWKIGLSLVSEENNGVISDKDFRSKIDELLSHEDLRENSLKFKESVRKSVAEGGPSFAAMQGFIKQLQS